MSITSKDVFKTIVGHWKEFESLGEAWCANDDINAVAKSRNYGKRLLKDMKTFVELSITEADKIMASAPVKFTEVPTPEIAEVVEVVQVPVAPVAPIAQPPAKEVIVDKPVVKPEIKPTVETKVEVKPNLNTFADKKKPGFK